MADKLILDLATTRKYINISPNYNEERFNMFASRVQDEQLRELLNPVLYQKLYADLDANGVPQNIPYIELVNGAVYDLDGDNVQYFGLKPYLAFNWGAINLREGNNFQADYGNIQFNDNPQDNMIKTNQSSLDRANSSLMKSVTSYRNNIVEYLNDNTGIFPDWESKKENKSKTQFNIITV